MKRFLFGFMAATAVWFSVAAWHPTAPSHTPAGYPEESAYLELATNYMQNAAEYRALCYQAYNTATYQLQQIHTAYKAGQTDYVKPLAVVVDVDETVLDNSPYQGDLVLHGGRFPERWVDWCNTASAKPVPGALEFLQSAEMLGVTVFYVTNRRKPEVEGTLKNLQALGFPNADADHLMYRTSTGDKTARRAKVSETHEIVMLCGDNLPDFTELFEDQPIERRAELADSLRSQFGSTFIQLPNPMYGGWYGALIDNQYRLSLAEQAKLRYSRLRGFSQE